MEFILSSHLTVMNKAQVHCVTMVSTMNTSSEHRESLCDKIHHCYMPMQWLKNCFFLLHTLLWSTMILSSLSSSSWVFSWLHPPWDPHPTTIKDVCLTVLISLNWVWVSIYVSVGSKLTPSLMQNMFHTILWQAN